MVSWDDVPADAFWVQVDGDGRTHPYGMHKLVNCREIEVVDNITSDDTTSLRWVLLRNGEYEVWVEQQYKEEYGYNLQEDERVSEAERNAITLKQRAIRDGSSVTLEEVSSYAEYDDPDVLGHALIAAYYAAKANLEVPDTEVAELREQVREKTGHVDLSHPPTVMKILREFKGEQA